MNGARFVLLEPGPTKAAGGIARHQRLLSGGHSRRPACRPSCPVSSADGTAGQVAESGFGRNMKTICPIQIQALLPKRFQSLVLRVVQESDHELHAEQTIDNIGPPDHARRAIDRHTPASDRI